MTSNLLRAVALDALSQLAQAGDKTAQAMLTLVSLLHHDSKAKPEAQADSETVAPAPEQPEQFAKPKAPSNYDYVKRQSLN